MNVPLFLLFLALSYISIAQSSVYQSFEVDSTAQPQGGMTYLTTFIQANLRKPIAAEAKGVAGLVVVSGTVEADGHIFNVSVTKSLRPDCDREAARVFKLYNAWKPAQKGGKIVRQQVNIPVRFTANAPYTYIDGKQILYFDVDLKLLADSTNAAKFKQVSPVDTNGLYTGDLVLFKFVNNQWEEYARDSLVRRPNGNKDIVGKPVLLVAHQGSVQGLNGCQYTVGSSGEMLSEQCYKVGKPVGQQLTYHLNSVLQKRNEEINGRRISTTWYANGQIQQIQETNADAPLNPSVTKVTASWDSAGRQVVKNGNGAVKIVVNGKARYGKDGEMLIREQGTYKNYVKQGTWIGRSLDNTYFYEEQYDNGVLLAGKSHVVGQDTATYGTENRLPAFPGGKQGLASFLAANLRYPVDAQKAGVQGMVQVSFFVCTDGTLCDYVVEDSAHPALDKEALRVVRKTSGQWQPAVHNGKRVKVKFTLPVNFSLR